MTSNVEFQIEGVFELSDGRNIFLVADPENVHGPIERSTWQIRRVGSCEPMAFIEIHSELLKRGPHGQRSLETTDPITFNKSDIESGRWSMVLVTD